MTNKDLLNIDYLARRYDEANIPLYLSYPTTNWWKTSAQESDFVKAFQQTADPLFYFHFPYCRKACYYCVCYNHVTPKDKDKDIYLTYLAREYNKKLDLLGLNRVENIRHMHWGGGTPTYMSCHQIERIFDVILNRATLGTGPGTSISIEAYPDDTMLPREKLRLLRDLGFNEISFGIQDFDARVQKTIHRDISRQCTETLIETSKEMGFRVHIDLCYGLPFQGLNELEKTVRAIIGMGPDRIALFPYAHYPMVFPLQRMIPGSSIPNSFQRVLMAKTAGEMFAAENFCQVGTDHFVKQGDPLYLAWSKGAVVRNFMGYSVKERKEHLGFGNSAISFIGNRFFHNIISLKEYYTAMDQNRFPLEKAMAHTLSGDDRIRNKLIQQNILCDFEIDKTAVSQAYAIDFDTYFEKELNNLKICETDGLVSTQKPGKIMLTDRGRYFARHIAHVFDSYYN